jgi:hypothetical protein
MSKRVESIEITFENLDYINIPAEYFGEFYITGIQTTVERLALNAIVQRTRADQIDFELLARVDVALSDMLFRREYLFPNFFRPNWERLYL